MSFFHLFSPPTGSGLPFSLASPVLLCVSPSHDEAGFLVHAPWQAQHFLKSRCAIRGKHIFLGISLNKHLACLLCLSSLRSLPLRLPLAASLGWSEEANNAFSDLLLCFRLDELYPTQKRGIVWDT
jgi:hypothetical protein